MKLQYWADCLQAARDFAGDHAGDFDIELLASALFTYDLNADAYVECEYTDADIQACDVSTWQDTCVPTEDGTLLYERWFQSSALGPVYVGAWENIDSLSRLPLSGTAGTTCGTLVPWLLPTLTHPQPGVSLTGPMVLAKLGRPTWPLPNA